MSTDPESSPTQDAPRRGPWRFGTPMVVLACGALFVTSAVNSEGTDLRPGRYTDLSSLVASENREYEQLEARVQELTAQVDRLAGQVGSTETRRLQRQVDELRAPAGLTPVTGPGLSVTLSDAPEEVINSSSQDVEKLIVHQQDIQAVVNAMWAGGAEAITIQGQRIVTTTGIKCEGNSVMLGGAVYPQPYTIEAIGDPDALEGAVLADPWVGGFRRDASIPDVSVGFEMTSQEGLDMPAYGGVTGGLTYAQPVR